MTLSEVYVVTNTEHGWDCIMEVFNSEDAAKEYVEWWSEYTAMPKDVLVVHCPHKVHETFNKEDFE